MSFQSSTAAEFQAFLSAAPHIALVEVVQAKGSTPREGGAWMLVAPRATFGTIGGGQLEFMVIAKARESLGSQEPAKRGGSILPESENLAIPLGPEIGQCCGGWVDVKVTLLDQAGREEVGQRIEAEDARRPHVYLFGGGHVGHALAAALSLLPLNVTVVETRAEALEGLPAGVGTLLTPVPEEAVRKAPAGSAYVVLTHDHALDFLIVAESLKRTDAAYVGMIGSSTKKATFRSWYLKQADGAQKDFERLVTPIGGSEVRDKRPAVIAAMAASEIVAALSRQPVAGDRRQR